jgi:hypothetical protein
MNVKCHLVAGNPLMRKLPDQVTRDWPSELPAVLRCERLGIQE